MSCVDAAHDQAVATLGPEDPAIAPGPLHRVGQPCIVCHGGSGPASAEFSVAGTVYSVQGQSQPAVDAVVPIEDIDGREYVARTNAAGNFFVMPATFAPHYPIKMSVMRADGSGRQQMLSLSLREGSCAGCHTNPPGPLSPGEVYLSAASVGSSGASDGGAE